jgi:hypothetical protein
MKEIKVVPASIVPGKDFIIEATGEWCNCGAWCSYYFQKKI